MLVPTKGWKGDEGWDDGRPFIPPPPRKSTVSDYVFWTGVSLIGMCFGIVYVITVYTAMDIAFRRTTESAYGLSVYPLRN